MKRPPKLLSGDRPTLFLDGGKMRVRRAANGIHVAIGTDPIHDNFAVRSYIMDEVDVAALIDYLRLVMHGR